MKKNNLRRCLMTKKTLNKNDLYRFVIVENKMIFDKDKKLQGRGYYISKEKKFDAIEGFILKRFKMNLEK